MWAPVVEKRLKIGAKMILMTFFEGSKAFKDNFLL